MKYGLGIKILISFIVGGIAILYKLRLDPNKNQSEVSSIVKVPKPFLFKTVTTLSNVPIYFTWITRFDEVNNREILRIGKSYRGTIDLPFFGRHEIFYSITDFQEGSWIVFKPDLVRGSYLNTEVILMFTAINNTAAQFYMKIIYHRSSALFQLTVGRLLKSLTDSQLDKVLVRVRALAISKWAIWQDTPTPVVNSTKSSSRVVIKDRATSDSNTTPGKSESRKRGGKKPH